MWVCLSMNKENNKAENSQEKELPELSDGVVRLKPFEMADAEKHLRGDDSEQEKWLSGGKSTLEGVQEWIKRNQEYWEKNGPIFNLSIRTSDDNKLVGMIEANIDFRNVEGIEEGDANISYGLYPEAREKGYMIRAVALVEKFLQNRGIKRAVIRVAPENVNSLRVPVGCGFKEAGQLETKNGDKLIMFVKELQK